MGSNALGDLDQLFDKVIGELGHPATLVPGGAGDVFMEIMNTADMSTWMCLEPVTEDQFKRIEPQLPWIRSGRAPAAMDRAAFAHPPGKPDDFSSMQCGDLTFRHVATPLDFDPSIFAKKGAIRLLVDKHHILGFAAGREITVMDLDGASYIELIGTSEEDSDLALPPGANLRKITHGEPLIIHLPNPTVTYFWFGQARSFQGPVDLP